jgi:hypothetical protein
MLVARPEPTTGFRSRGEANTTTPLSTSTLISSPPVLSPPQVEPPATSGLQHRHDRIRSSASHSARGHRSRGIRDHRRARPDPHRHSGRLSTNTNQLGGRDRATGRGGGTGDHVQRRLARDCCCRDHRLVAGRRTGGGALSTCADWASASRRHLTERRLRLDGHRSRSSGSCTRRRRVSRRHRLPTSPPSLQCPGCPRPAEWEQVQRREVGRCRWATRVGYCRTSILLGKRPPYGPGSVGHRRGGTGDHSGHSHSDLRGQPQYVDLTPESLWLEFRLRVLFDRRVRPGPDRDCAATIGP